MFEINLVPDVKAEMIATQKKRNLVIVAAIAVSIIAAGLVVLLMSIKIGQDIKISGQDNKLELMSNKIEEYDGLESLLTVQKQLSDISAINVDKKLLSRVFTVLHSIVNVGSGVEIDISALDVDMESSVLSFDGQANAGVNTDGIDFAALETWKETVLRMKYDYGRYVDSQGNVIPTMCIFESDYNGTPFVDSEKRVYAIWAKNVTGCDPAKIAVQREASEGTYKIDTTKTADELEKLDISRGCDDPNLVCIYRTPLFKDWFNNGNISTDGVITGVEHFESQCITYSKASEKDPWADTNNCMMLVEDGIEINNPTNGRVSGGDPVLMFAAVLRVDPEVFSFNNKHMIAISPSGRQNVTDSYTQIGDMFAERAKSEGSE